MRSLSLWHDTLPADDTMSPRSSLPGDLDVDVAIVGAGFTGLWTAHYLRAADPTLRIAIVDKHIAGFGASGRNGGWASAILPMGLDTIASGAGGGDAGRDAAIRMQREMHHCVDEVGRAAAELGIDCHYAKGGQLDFVRNPAQLQRARDSVEHAAAYGLDDVRWLDTAEMAEHGAAANLLGGVYTPHCAVIHPARLARGLATSVEARGVAVYEQTTVSTIEPHRVVTDHGTIRADVVVRATEGFTPSLSGEKRTIVPVYSLMIATEPLPASAWDEIGLAARETFNDGRHLIIYGQRTADGRIAFGGRGAPYHFGSAVKPAFDRDPRVHEMLRETLVEIFPQVRDAAITHRWGGPLGLPRDWYCGVGLDRGTGLAWAGGYVGDGVTTTNLAGRTLSDLILGHESDITDLPWVGHRSRKWEPEPIRWMSIRTSLKLPAGADRYEHRTKKPERVRSWILGKLTAH
ncbi:MAG: puuB 1 [Ilumatobacteraceae bacterium]|nr:puuB 1 [Ilumatobacteraceae bacterium]